MRRILAIIAAGVCFSTPLFSQDSLGAKTKFIFDATVGGEQGTLIRYGNWYGPGWWGGSEGPKRVGLLPPIDALDTVAQKHDFGCQVAEELGKGRPELVAYYKAMADGIAVRDTMALPEDPALWSPPPRDIAQARVYRDRIAVGFKEYVQKWNALMAWRPTKRLDPTWNNGAVAVLSITIAGTKVRISRKDAGFSIGFTAIYEGKLAPDGTIQGNSTATWPGHFTNQVQPWQGRIVK